MKKIKTILIVGISILGLIFGIIGLITTFGRDTLYKQNLLPPKIVYEIDMSTRGDSLKVPRPIYKYKPRLIPPDTVQIIDTVPVPKGGIYDISYFPYIVSYTTIDTNGFEEIHTQILSQPHSYFFIAYDTKTGENHFYALTDNLRNKVVLKVYGLIGIHSTGLYASLSKGMLYFAVNTGYSYINRGYFDVQLGIRLKKWEF